MSKPEPEAKLVTLYPVPGQHIPGVPHVQQDVTPERAAELLAYQPPVFTTDPPSPPKPDKE